MTDVAAVERRSRLAKWQAINLGLLVMGYAGYYLCRSNLQQPSLGARSRAVWQPGGAALSSISAYTFLRHERKMGV